MSSPLSVVLSSGVKVVTISPVVSFVATVVSVPVSVPDSVPVSVPSGFGVVGPLDSTTVVPPSSWPEQNWTVSKKTHTKVKSFIFLSMVSTLRRIFQNS